MITVAQVCKALRADRDPRSGFVRETGRLGVAFPAETWLETAGFWVRDNGRYVSGWREGKHFARRFGPVAAWRIRRAVRAWRAANSVESQPSPPRA